MPFGLRGLYFPGGFGFRRRKSLLWHWIVPIFNFFAVPPLAKPRGGGHWPHLETKGVKNPARPYGKWAYHENIPIKLTLR